MYVRAHKYIIFTNCLEQLLTTVSCSIKKENLSLVIKPGVAFYSKISQTINTTVVVNSTLLSDPVTFSAVVHNFEQQVLRSLHKFHSFHISRVCVCVRVCFTTLVL